MSADDLGDDLPFAVSNIRLSSACRTSNLASSSTSLDIVVGQSPCRPLSLGLNVVSLVSQLRCALAQTATCQASPMYKHIVHTISHFLFPFLHFRFLFLDQPASQPLPRAPFPQSGKGQFAKLVMRLVMRMPPSLPPSPQTHSQLWVKKAFA